MLRQWSPTWSAPAPGRGLTLDEWARLSEEDGGELVDGFLMEEEVPDPAHELSVTWLIHLFMSWMLGRGGFVFGSDVKLRVSASKGRKPDVAVYLPGGATPPRRGLLRAPPDILVEVVTPTPRDERRDRVEKMAEYEALGVRYYWLLDPALGTLEIFALGADAKFVRALAATAGRVEEVPGCPALVVDLDHLWSELARLGPEEPESD